MQAEPVIVLVVAVSRNGVIGREGGLPWTLSSDLKLFKQLTMGKPIVMGRKTFASIGRPLPGRTNIVVTRSETFVADGVERAGSLDEALALARTVALRDGVSEICVIGGGEIYRQALDQAGRVYLTEVHAHADGDTTFPELDPAQWREVSRTHYPAGERDSADFSFVVMERTGSGGNGA